MPKDLTINLQLLDPRTKNELYAVIKVKGTKIVDSFSREYWVYAFTDGFSDKILASNNSGIHL